MKERNHSFEVLFENVEAKTNQKLKTIINAARAAGFSKGQSKATEFYVWLKNKYDLGRGYAQAIWINFDDISD